MRSFATQLFFGNILILCLVLCVGFILTFYESHRFHSEHEKELLEDVLAISVKELAVDFMKREAGLSTAKEFQDRVDLYCQVYAEAPELRFTIFDVHGNVLGDSKLKSEDMVDFDIKRRPEILAAMRGEDGEHIRKSDYLPGQSFRFLAKPIFHGDRIVGLCRIGYSQEVRAADARQLFRMILARFLLMFAAASIFFLLLSRLWSQPLQAITLSSQRIADGNLEEPISVAGPVEIQQLARALDTMKERVAADLRSQQIQVDFVANASHELRTPLTVIRAATDNLLEVISLENETVDHSEDKTLLHLVDVLDRNVRRLESMTAFLLDLYRVETGQIDLDDFMMLTPDSIEQFIHDLFDRKAEEKNIHLSIFVNETGPPFPTDGRRLFPIVQNLIDNAVKYTPPGGSIHFSASDHPVEKREYNRELVIVCSDNGPGIKEEDQPRIFERFYRSNSFLGSERVRGAGLGLTIVKNAVERLKGTVQLKSRPGQGTTITVRLPFLKDLE